MIKKLCTVSDYNYLNKGLALYESLQKHSNGFQLYYLCLDDKTYDHLTNLNLANLTPINSKSVHLNYTEIEPYNYYCWSLASRFSQYLVNKYDFYDILYIDSDIFFFNNVDIVYDEMYSVNKSIGIIPHLNLSYDSPNGKYNVGIVYFKNDDVGRGCLDFWVSCVTNSNNPYFEEYGTCGDQKYLELFEIKYEDGVHILGNTFAQAAPWNYYLFDYIDKNKVVLEGKQLPLVFIHFCKFVFYPESDTYEPMNDKSIYTKEILPFKNVVEMYDDYSLQIKDVYDKYQLRDKDCWYEDCYEEMKKGVRGESFPKLINSDHYPVLNSLFKECNFSKLLDIGCGGGGLSEVVNGEYYTGVDLPSIIENVAEKLFPNTRFIKCNALVDDLSFIKKYDLIVMNAFIDVLQNPIEVLNKILNHSSGDIIIHRQVFTDDITHTTKHYSYGGFAYHSIINRNEFTNLLKQKNYKIVLLEQTYKNDDTYSLILRKENV